MYVSIEPMIRELAQDMKAGKVDREFRYARDRCQVRHRGTPPDIIQYHVEKAVWCRLFQKAGGMPEFPGIEPLADALAENTRLGAMIVELKAGAEQDGYRIAKLENDLRQADAIKQHKDEIIQLKGQLLRQNTTGVDVAGHQSYLAMANLHDQTRKESLAMGAALMKMAEVVGSLKEKMLELERANESQRNTMAKSEREYIDLEGIVQGLEIQNHDYAAEIRRLEGLNRDLENRLSQASGVSRKQTEELASLKEKMRAQDGTIATLGRQLATPVLRRNAGSTN